MFTGESSHIYNIHMIYQRTSDICQYMFYILSIKSVILLLGDIGIFYQYKCLYICILNISCGYSLPSALILNAVCFMIKECNMNLLLHGPVMLKEHDMQYPMFVNRWATCIFTSEYYFVLS